VKRTTKILGNRPKGPLPSQSNLSIGTGSRRFRLALDFLEKHFYEPIGTEDLSRVSKLSRRGLHKAFRQHVGQSPGWALRRMRIQRAKNLLMDSKLELKVIAKMCGYRSQNSFWVSFREIVGESPGKFRSRYCFSPIHNKKTSWHLSGHGRVTKVNVEAAKFLLLVKKSRRFSILSSKV
jgi:transcriptional regulator GlxA family with amidase domain